MNDWVRCTIDSVSECVGLLFALLPGLALAIPLMVVDPPHSEKDKDSDTTEVEASNKPEESESGNDPDND